MPRAREAAETAAAVLSVRAGMAPAEAARLYGITDRTLRAALRRAGVPPKPVGRPPKRRS